MLEGLKTKPKILAAYTLIEMIMVIVIVAILLITVMPRFSGVNAAVKLKGAAKRVATDMRYAQSIALAQRTNTTLAFNLANNNYRAYYTLNNTNLTDPFSRQDLFVDFYLHNQYGGITLYSVDFSGGWNLTFNDRGVPLDNSGTALTADGTVVVDNGYDSLTIKVTAHTGLVSLL